MVLIERRDEETSFVRGMRSCIYVYRVSAVKRRYWACRLGASGHCRDSWLEDLARRDLDFVGLCVMKWMTGL